MKMLLKILILNGFWYFAIGYGEQMRLLNEYLVIGLAFALSLLNFIFYRPKINFLGYLICLLFFVLYGFTQDYLLAEQGWVGYPNDKVPLWLLSLYVIFIGYYGDVFNYFVGRHFIILFIVGAVGGSFAYFAGAKLAGLSVYSWNYLYAIAVSWGVFFPLSIYLFYGVFDRQGLVVE